MSAPRNGPFRRHGTSSSTPPDRLRSWMLLWSRRLHHSASGSRSGGESDTVQEQQKAPSDWTTRGPNAVGQQRRLKRSSAPILSPVDRFGIIDGNCNLLHNKLITIEHCRAGRTCTA